MLGIQQLLGSNRVMLLDHAVVTPRCSIKVHNVREVRATFAAFAATNPHPDQEPPPLTLRRTLTRTLTLTLSLD